MSIDAILVGLGNPGPQYALTRHNIGFMCVDAFAKNLDSQNWAQDHKALVCKTKIKNQAIILAKPQTFMNLSGESVISILQFYKIPIENLIVAHDEIDIPFNSMRVHKNRSPGGHNGIKSISQLLGTNDYTRLRLGVGRPAHPEMSVADFVLQKFSQDEFTALPDFLARVGNSIQSILFDGFNKAASVYNK